METNSKIPIRLRRIIIRSISILYVLSMVFTLVSALGGTLQEYVALNPIPPWFYGYVYVAFAVYLAGFGGIFFFKKTFLHGLAILTVISHPILLTLGLGNWTSLIIDIIVFGSFIWLFRYPLEYREGSRGQE